MYFVITVIIIKTMIYLHTSSIEDFSRFMLIKVILCKDGYNYINNISPNENLMMNAFFY